MKKFLSGFGIILSGFKTLQSTKKLWLWVCLPFLINLIAIFFSLGWMLSHLASWIAMALGYLFVTPYPWYYYAVYYPLYLLFAIGFSVSIIYLTLILVSILAGPLYSVLAEKTLTQFGALQRPPRTFKQLLGASFSMLRVSLLRALVLLPFAALIFALSFLPGLNIVASILAFLLIAFDCLDYVFEAREYPLGKRFQLFRENLLEMLGFAIALGLTLLIPGLTLLVLPIGVVGVATWYSQKVSQKVGVH